MSANFVALSQPSDVWLRIGSLLTVGDLLRLSQACQFLWNQFAAIAEELRRMQMPLSSLLTLEGVAAHWRELAPERLRAIRANLGGRLLESFSRRFDPATVLLSEEFIEARNDSEGIVNILIQQREIQRALVLAHSIPLYMYSSNRLYRWHWVYQLALQPGLPLADALEIAHSIKDKYWKREALFDLAKKQELSTALDIINSIPNEEMEENREIFDSKGRALYWVALRKGLPLATALEIARSIHPKHWRNSALQSLAERHGLMLEELQMLGIKNQMQEIKDEIIQIQEKRIKQLEEENRALKQRDDISKQAKQ